MSRQHRRRPPFVRRRARIGFYCAAWLAVLGAVLAAIAAAPRVHAEPYNVDRLAFEYWAHHGGSVCADLDHDPTLDGVAMAGLNVINRGHLTAQQAGQAIGLSVIYTCPRHQRLIDMFIGKPPHGSAVTIGVLR